MMSTMFGAKTASMYAPAGMKIVGCQRNAEDRQTALCTSTALHMYIQ